MKRKFLVLSMALLLVVLQLAVPMTTFADTNDSSTPSSYGYDETPADSVTVEVTVSNDGIPLMGLDAAETPLAHLEVTVPYFDLELYGLQQYYRYGTENGQGQYVNDKVVERPTALHLYIYLLERYYLGIDEEDCGTGEYKVLNVADEKSISYYDGMHAYNTDGFDSLTLTGSATSMYMFNFWGHDENLMYYRNHRYPLMSPGWGSCADYILLSEGDRIEVAMFTNWSFYHTGAFLSFDRDDYTAIPGQSLTVEVRGTATSPENRDVDKDNDGVLTPDDVKDNPETPILPYTEGDIDVALYNENWEKSEAEVTDNGDGTYTIQMPKRVGTYYVMATDADGGTDGADKSPGIAKIVSYDADAEFQQMKNDAKDEIEWYVDLDDYRQAQQDEINAIIGDAWAKIDAIADKADAGKMDQIVSDAKTAIDAVKTDAQLKAEEIAAFESSEVSNLSVSISGSTVKASWKAVDEADKYEVKIYRNNQLYKTTSVNGTSYKLTNATRGCKYTVKVTPKCTYNDEVYSGKSVSTSKTSNLSKASISVKKSGSYRIVKSADQNSTGYQIYIAKNKKFSKSVKKVTVTTSKGALSKKLKTTKYFKKGTNYIKVRAYTKINGKTQYGKWSTVKTVKR